ncbi:MAG: M56 family metallopeptidase, partial [Bacteroidales bacterium]|nr:M56 family metallopeptidase [Bacteroidales bacterium]
MFIFKYLLASTLLMLFYWGVMRRRASYRLRRNYLMLIPLLGLMGFMHFNVTETSTDDDIDPRQTPVAPTVVHYVPASGALTEVTEPTEVIEEDDPSSRPMEPMAYLVEKEADSADLHLESLLDNVLPLVSVLLLLFGLCQVVKMLMLKAKLPCTRTAEGYGLIRSAEVVTPFSFGRTIFLPTDMDQDCEEMVLMHEKAHIAHRHYLEVWGIDLLVCFLWFNPIVWLCRNELLKVHEFEADHDVLGQGIDKYDYQMSLLQMSMNVSCPVVSGFSQSLIYQRFVEMKASMAGTLSSVGKVCLLAWVAGLFGIFSFYACQVTTVQSEGNPTPSSELFATLDSLPRLEKPETFTFEYICDSLCRDTVLYVFLSDDFFHFSNPVPAETLHVKDGKMSFQMELDHVIGMKWHLLPDNRLGFERFCSPGDTIWQFATRNEETHNREWRSGESQTYRANVDKYIHEFRELTHWQSP